jgi:hypothetical protein
VGHAGGTESRHISLTNGALTAGRGRRPGTRVPITIVSTDALRAKVSGSACSPRERTSSRVLKSTEQEPGMSSASPASTSTRLLVTSASCALSPSRHRPHSRARGRGRPAPRPENGGNDAEDRLGHRVVIGVADRCHRLPDPGRRHRRVRIDGGIRSCAGPRLSRPVTRPRHYRCPCPTGRRTRSTVPSGLEWMAISP